MPAVPSRIVIELPAAEQADLLRQLRRARWGSWLTLHIVLLLVQQRSPSDIADWLLCSRSTVYAAAAAWQQGRRPWEPNAEGDDAAGLPAGLTPDRRRSLLALLKQAPSAFGWCRTRWSCATLATSLRERRGWAVSAETVRRWLHALDYRWKRAKPIAKDNDPARVPKLARIRLIFESLRPREAMLFGDELDVHLLPKSGYQWMAKGTQVEVMTPGKNEKRYVAGAWNVQTGAVEHVVWYKKQAGLFVELLAQLERAYPARRYDRIYVVVDNYKIHKAQRVGRWLATHPRIELVFQPTYCPRSNPLERVYGDTHDQVTRNHRRKRIRDLVRDVARHFRENGPWLYRLSEIYYTPEVTAAVERLRSEREQPAA